MGLVDLPVVGGQLAFFLDRDGVAKRRDDIGATLRQQENLPTQLPSTVNIFFRHHLKGLPLLQHFLWRFTKQHGMIMCCLHLITLNWKRLNLLGLLFCFPSELRACKPTPLYQAINIGLGEFCR